MSAHHERPLEGAVQGCAALREPAKMSAGALPRQNRQRLERWRTSDPANHTLVFGLQSWD